MIVTILYILQWIFSVICVAIVLSVISWPFLLNTTSFANMPHDISGDGVQHEVRQKIDNKLFDWIYNDLFRFLLPTTAIIIIVGFVLLVLIGLISFALLLISLLA
jgi:hypothetical protein